VDPDLQQLAAVHGVATEYDDQRGRPVQVAAAAVVRILAALGVDASSPAAIAAALAAEASQRRDRLAPRFIAARQGVTRRVELRAADGLAARVRLEDGTWRDVPVSSDGELAWLAVDRWPVGWHTLVVTTAEEHAEVPVCVAPQRLPAGDRAWGWMTQLYAVRSNGSWGVGDLRDLGTLAGWTAARGGGLLLVNPLHAVAPGVPVQPSPYYPASRRWTNPLYLRIEDTEAYAAAPAEVRERVDGMRAEIENRSELVDRDSSWAVKLTALSLLAPYATESAIDPTLADFATWCALAEVYGNDWREWPEELQRPDAPAVGAARKGLHRRVRFHAWLQHECDRQLRRVQRQATEAGMPIGIVHDLAVGTDPAGADAWALQDALALGAHIGAPPDGFNQRGQDWGMPPWHPRRLEELGYAPLRDLVAGLLRHAGGVRIDHILGLFRAWWVPAGGSARDGSFVSYDAEAMLAVIVLEAFRAGGVVVGEDLGTTPPYIPKALEERGVLGSSVLWFEREDTTGGELGARRPLDRWREAAMASVTTHDLPTALGWLRGEHVDVRTRLGLLDDPVEEARSWRRERAELLSFLADAGLLDDSVTEDELIRALHLALVRSPSRLVMAALGDAVGDLRQPNLPGTLDEYPNWRLPVADSEGRALLLDDLLADERVQRLAADLTSGISAVIR
jgi:4-alpha-glucanotransferase